MSPGQTSAHLDLTFSLSLSLFTLLEAN
uniref:Uncharacterized protein n=1 Tax=Tetranychus urticae TaxID=32264 RepID=T1L4F4_TETUR